MTARIAALGLAAIGVLGLAGPSQCSGGGGRSGGRTATLQDTTKRMEQLKQRLYSLDQDTSGLALGELVKLGREATPVLLDALTHDNPRTRRLAAEGLGEIADPAAADALFRATKDPNDEVRARASTALAALGDSRAPAALVANLNDYPDLLHNPYTATMYPLMRSGREVLPLVAPLLRSSDELTRQRAFLVLKAVVSRLPDGKDWDALSRSLGSYDPKAPAAERDRAADQWQTWVRSH